MPVVDEVRRRVYWVGRAGYLSVVLGASGSEPKWTWQPWENDEFPAQALAELGPPFRATGQKSGFWQLCADKSHDKSNYGDEQKICLKLGGDSVQDKLDVDGEFMTTGRSSFSWNHDFWSDPWDATGDEQSAMRIPLLQQTGGGQFALLAKAEWIKRYDFGLLSETINGIPGEKFKVRLALESAGQPEKIFTLEMNGVDQTLFLRSAAGIAVFVYKNHLHLFFQEIGKCYRWSLRGAK